VALIERLAESHSPRGELVLRRRDEHLELISNGTFLMDTASGASERAMAELGLSGSPAGARVLIGGLGFGFTLATALGYEVAQVTVVEIEAEVIAWNREWWPLARAALDDDRVTVVVDDLAHVLHTTTATFDAVLLDVDNGPEWTVTDANGALYGDPGLHRLAQLIVPSGRLCVWSATDSAAFSSRLQRHFEVVSTHRIPVARGNPDVIFVASTS
jgi:spermidine synthase